MYPGYLNVGCNEVVNAERAATYALAMGLRLECDRCPDLPNALDHDPYSSPAEDDAPWYDPTRPESADFLGVFAAEEITGLSGSTIERNPAPRVGDGAVVGAARHAAREISYQVSLIAVSECGLSYGLGWLARALSADPCRSSCTGTSMTVYSCCPGSIPELGFGDGEIRYLYDVGLSDGPRLVERQWVNDSVMMATVEFTLTAGQPWIYADALRTGDEAVDLSSGVPVRRDPDAVFDRCLPPRPCASDPDCPRPALPPSPPEPDSPCYRRGVDDWIVTRVMIASDDYPLWDELVPVVEVDAGATDLTRVLVRFWANPTNADCDTAELDPCDACSDINVSFIPAAGVLTVDGRTQRSVIECETPFRGVFTSPPDLYGQRGRLFRHSVFPCPTGLCVEFWVREQDVSPGSGATGQVRLVPRMQAI